MQFQSTPPVKAATFKVRKADNDVLFQSTPPVKAATIRRGMDAADMTFQSTPPVKAATLSRSRCRQKYRISIHAAREGGDYNGI